MGSSKDTLGIEKEKTVTSFFSAVEHPLPYCKCVKGHFHVPIYSRVNHPGRAHPPAGAQWPTGIIELRLPAGPE